MGYIENWDSDSGRLVEFNPEQNDDERFDHALTEIAGARKLLVHLGKVGVKMIKKAVDPDDAILAAKYLRQINEIGPRLSPASQIWLTKFEIETALQALDYLLAQKHLWNKPVEQGAS